MTSERWAETPSKGKPNTYDKMTADNVDTLRPSEQKLMIEGARRLLRANEHERAALQARLAQLDVSDECARAAIEILGEALDTDTEIAV